MHQLMHKNLPLFLLAVASAALGVLLGACGMYVYAQSDAQTIKGFRLAQSEYPLINPLLMCSAGTQQSSAKEDKALSKTIGSLTDELIHDGKADDLSVYIINYKNGTWAGVNPDARYDPASLLKVPLMIAYYTRSEDDTNLLSQVFSFNGDSQNDGEHFVGSDDIVAGRSYSNEELISHMIRSSDNTAAVLLEQGIPHKELASVYTDLGLPVPEDGSNVSFISAKMYAYFFRVLYNATYASHKDSQTMLDLLTKTSFTEGIVAGVPAGTVVAHKFGERNAITVSGSSESTNRELHDCGIVYKPNSPFLICVMTSSQNASFETLAGDITNISKAAYDQI